MGPTQEYREEFVKISGSMKSAGKEFDSVASFGCSSGFSVC